MEGSVHIFTATALGRGSMASPTLGHLYPPESPVLILRRMSGPQDQSGHERVKIYHTLRYPGSNLGLSARSQATRRFSFLA